MGSTKQLNAHRRGLENRRAHRGAIGRKCKQPASGWKSILRHLSIPGAGQPLRCHAAILLGPGALHVEGGEGGHHENDDEEADDAASIADHLSLQVAATIKEWLRD